MECRKFSITLISATNLPNVREFGRMKVYGKVSIAGKSETEQQTQVDKENGTNPVWNCTARYTVGEAAVQAEGVVLVIKLYCERTFGDRDVGEVNLSLKRLFDHAKSATIDYSLDQRDSSVSQGTLKVSYTFGEKEVVERSSSLKKALLIGAKILFEVTLNVMGIDVEIPIFIGGDGVEC